MERALLSTEPPIRAFLEYYPAFSPDDAFVAFNRAPAPSNTTRCRENNPTVRT